MAESCSGAGELHLHTFDTNRLEAGANNLVVDTPPSDDPNRTKPYPTLYLSHGGGGNEIDGTTQGAAQNILDRLIGTGEIQPMVAVMPNAGGYSGDNFREDYDRDVIDVMIPLVEKNYNVSQPPTTERSPGCLWAES